MHASAEGHTARHGPYLDNEIQDIYVYWPQETFPTERMVLQTEEVDRVEYWDWKEYRRLSLRNDPELVPRSPMYKEKIFPWFDQEISHRC